MEISISAEEPQSSVPTLNRFLGIWAHTRAELWACVSDKSKGGKASIFHVIISISMYSAENIDGEADDR